jgi:hypothetical protein
MMGIAELLANTRENSPVAMTEAIPSFFKKLLLVSSFIRFPSDGEF